MEERRFSAATSGAQSIRASAQRYLVVMDPEQDTEITLGTAKLLSLFFGLVVICAVFFALGYTLGRKTDAIVSATTLGPLPASNGAKPGSSGATPSAPMTFYKNVEQQNANPQLTPAKSVSENNSATAAPPAQGAESSSSPPA